MLSFGCQLSSFGEFFYWLTSIDKKKGLLDSMDYSRLITTTSQRVAAFVVDAIHGSSVLVGRVTGGNVTPWEMGVYEKQPIQISDVTTAIDFQGIGNFNTSDNTTDVNLQWEAKGLGDSVIIGYAELGLNQTKAQVINLVKRKFDVIRNSLIAGAGTRLYGLGAGAAIEGLQLSTDNSTYSSSYAGLSRATYGTYINGQVTAASSGVISFNTLAAQIDLCSAAASTMESTNLILTTKTCWALIEKLVETKSRGNYDTSRGNLRVTPYSPMGVAMDAAQVGMAGYESIYFRGIPTVKDDQTPSGLVYTLNENHLDFVSSPIAYCESISMGEEVTKGALDSVKTTAWQVSKEAKPTNGLGDVRQMAIYGNFVNRNPVRSGVITGVTTV